jgi:ribosomal protein S12 methylthiotransferase
MKQTNYKVGFVSLGCPKALVDSERIITQLRAEGYELVDTYKQAALVIINTCGFIQSAIDESLTSIAEALDQNGKVIVTGCLGAKPETILERFPQVLHISGPQSYESVMTAVRAHLPAPHDPFSSLIPPQGIKLTPRHYAYLKISEGCNHKCTFCIIPSMRGRLVSRPIDQVMQEAEKLVAAGVKELLIISQDTSAYGLDLKYEKKIWRDQERQTRFYDLVNALGELGVWVRLHYVYPYPHVDDIMPLMAEGKVLPYLDIPFQHASPRILKLMKRPASTENVLKRIQSWRTVCPDITIRSTFIVGFPGETEEEFQELLDFIQEAEIDRAGCFVYSPVPGAKANELPDPIPEDVQQERYDRFMSLQAEISAEKMRAKIGKTFSVLIDDVQAKYAIGRTSADAPEIDGLVYVRHSMPVQKGQIIQVRVEKADAYDLHGVAL